MADEIKRFWFVSLRFSYFRYHFINKMAVEDFVVCSKITRSDFDLEPWKILIDAKEDDNEMLGKKYSQGTNVDSTPSDCSSHDKGILCLPKIHLC